MQCPDDVREVVSDILTTGLLRVRSLAWAGDASRCAIEADHLHNLPSLLGNYEPEKLSYYWHVEKPAFESASRSVSLDEFDPLWARLAPHVPESAEAILTS
ncbi:MAG: hypothetical protein HZA46_15260 [Planctomycetales bacterium]|nr:hypothetical protein [Planctomycetales bacterium]